ncbi:MAG TPA: helix-turn-helix transcriptional regulator [Thermoanaerobaculia bacterium]|nr:helix-turn-helix transcriptional regulator [Thermoanaerobaculia bacterium]
MPFAVLLALAPGPLHGYAVMKDVNRRLRRRAVIGPGTLYRTLKELRDLGWIGEADERPGESDDERRRYYQLTEEGREAAVSEAERLSELVEDARAVRLIGDGGARS